MCNDRREKAGDGDERSTGGGGRSLGSATEAVTNEGLEVAERLWDRRLRWHPEDGGSREKEDNTGKGKRDD